MRLGILDLGSNTVHLLVADVEPGSPPVPAADESWDSPLLVDDDPREALRHSLSQARRRLDELGVTDVSAFATSAFRDHPDVTDLLAPLREEYGVDVHVLDGDDEARLTFLAARRWFGWGAGRLLVMDIGGGSLELAVGADEAPEHVLSLPLGARRLTLDHLHHDPPKAKEVERLEALVASTVAERLRPFRLAELDLAAGTSKTLRSLARIAGAAPYSEGQAVRRVLQTEDAERLVDKLRHLNASERARLPGVSEKRADQLLAGAVVAATTMRLLEIEELVICPWALREGIVLTRQEWANAI